MSAKSSVRAQISSFRQASAAGALLFLLFPSPAHAADLQWAGRSWKVTSGGMAGVAAGSPSNVSIDSSGYLHLKITNTGGAWTASEVFSTDSLGFGTYQWQVDGPIDRFDKNVVLGLYPYGPAANIGQDGTNEIDIEYSFWGNADGVNGDWTDYPSTGTTIGEKSYKFSLSGGTYSTSRFIWSATSIQNFLLTGFQSVSSTTGLLNSWTYAPSAPNTNIPQQAMPLGINLWCFDAPPSDGKNVEVVIRDFQFVPEGSSGGTATGGAGGMTSGVGGATNTAGAGGSTNSAGGAGSLGGFGGANAGVSGYASSGSPGVGGNGSASGATGAATSGATSAPATGGSIGTAGASETAPGGISGSSAVTATDAGNSSGCSMSPKQHRPRSPLLFALPLALLSFRRRQRRACAR